MDPREWRDLASGMFGGPVAPSPESVTEVELQQVAVSTGRDASVPRQPTPPREEIDGLAPGEALFMLDRLSLVLTQVTDGDEALRALGRWAMMVSGPVASLVDRVTVEGLTRVSSSGDPRVAGLLTAPPHQSLQGAGPSSGYLESVVTRGAAHWSPDFLQDTLARPWHAGAAVSGVRSAGTVAIRVGGQVSALLTVLWSRRYAAEQEVRALLAVAADLTAFRLEALTALEQSDLHRLRYAEAAGDVVRLHEVECGRIAGVIYDDAVQMLAALDLQVGWLHQRVARSAPQLGESVGRVHDLVRGATEGLRELLIDLEPDRGEDGFEILVRDAVAQVFGNSALDVGIRVSVGPDSCTGYLGSPERNQGLRIVREILLDARDRPQVSRVEVAIRPRHAGIEVRVHDDGAVDAVTPSGRPRRRLSIARLRAALVGGTFMTTTSDGGTEARLWLPLRAVGHGQGEAARGEDQEPGVEQGGGA